MIVLTAEQTKKRIAANLATVMKDRGASVRQLAKAIGESHSSVHTMIMGQNDSRVSMVAKAAEHFGITVDDLLLPAYKFSEILKKESAVA